MKIFKSIIIALVLLVLVLVGVVLCVWHNEIATLSSLELLRERDDSHHDGAVYTMKVKGGFYLEDFIEQGGVKNDLELFEFISNKVTKGLMKFGFDPSEIGCSSFTATDKSGDKLMARNYDIYDSNTCILYTENDGERHSTISTVDLSFLGIDRKKNIETLKDKIVTLAAPYVPMDGINDAGVSCGINMSYQGIETVATEQNTDRPDMNSSMLVRLILDYADDVDEAVEIAKSYDMHDSVGLSFHYLVADASGRSVILQWVGKTKDTDDDGSKRELKVIYCEDDDKVGSYEAKWDNQVNTNFILQPGYFDTPVPLEKNGFDRYELIWEKLDAVNCIVEDEKEAMDILASVGARKWYEGSGAVTVHSVVYNLTDKSVMWVPNEHFDDENAYYRFSFDK